MSAMVRYLESLGIQVRYAKGGWQPVKCPYHSDRTASASVNSTTDRFHCFVCDISEDIIGLIRRDTGVSYAEAKQAAEADFGADAEVVGVGAGYSGVLSGLTRNRSRNGEGLSSWRSSLP